MRPVAILGPSVAFFSPALAPSAALASSLDPKLRRGWVPWREGAVLVSFVRMGPVGASGAKRAHFALMVANSCEGGNREDIALHGGRRPGQYGPYGNTDDC
uniref:Uncharacterized protein n=1 Tax=Arundo donax TaxID=35708 RepID=A0A0A8XQS5_ARUDO